jgi:hypothetical protein
MIPPGYFEIGVALDALSFVVTFLVASMSYRLYRFFHKPSYLQFSAGFFLISISYLFFGFINLFSYAEETRMFTHGLPLDVFFQIRSIALLLGLLILICLYYEITQRSLQVLVGLLILFIFVLGGANDFTFFILSALLFFFIVLKLFTHYTNNPKKNSLWALVGFTSLFTAKLLSSIIFLSNGIYLVAYFFKLAGVLAILYSLWVISR